MSRIVAIGDPTALAGYGLAGAEVVPATDPGAAARAWAALGDDVGLVLLTPTAHSALPDPVERGDRLWVVLPG